MGLSEELKEKVTATRHEEVLKGLGSVTSAIKSITNDDPELKKLLAQNKEAISTFVKAVEGIKNTEPTEVKVETNQDKVVSAISELATIMKGVDARLTALEKAPKPKKIKVTKRNGYNQTGTIDEVEIIYDK